MRMPNKGEDLTGKIGVCSIGRVALIIGSSIDHEGWDGLGIDGKGVWFSSCPCIIAETAEEFHTKLIDRFKGKLP